MCGIAGFISSKHHHTDDALRDILVNMGNAIRRRGPDDAGYWYDSADGVGICHRRLSILDLSSAGAQPMISPSSRYVMSFNGEIYNHQSIRMKLEASTSYHQEWRGHSDTETLLAAIDSWGIEDTLHMIKGMFAFSVWDRLEKKLTLARDRFGEKPLYYGWQRKKGGDDFLFGSDLNALRKHPSFEDKVDSGSLDLFFRFNNIGGEHSVYTGINKLLPGHLLELTIDSPNPTIRQWWSSAQVIQDQTSNQFDGSLEDASIQLERLLTQVINIQMLSDVEVGAFLSGGIDSSTIVALMQQQTSKPIKTFCIGFEEIYFNEAKKAKLIANHLKTEHTELYINHRDVMNIIDKIGEIYDEPFADVSQIPTALVSQLASRHVKVVLSGDGGDELFCGYRRYAKVQSILGKVLRAPRSLRSLLKGISSQIPPRLIQSLGCMLTSPNFGVDIRQGIELLNSKDTNDLYCKLLSKHGVDLGIAPYRKYDYPRKISENLNNMSIAEQLMALDLMNYLPDDILVKLDRAAMGFSLEGRVPFLDHNIVEFAWSLPISYKYSEGTSKLVLREVLARHIPKRLTAGPKKGFGVPIGMWLRGPMRNWAESLLSDHSLSKFEVLPTKLIRNLWLEHLSGEKDNHQILWSILMFITWYNNRST